MAETVIRLFPLEAPATDPAAEHIRAVEAILFASAEPIALDELRQRLPAGAAVELILASLQQTYAGRGVNIVQVAGKWAFRTAPDLAYMMTKERIQQRKLSRAALETLAIIAYHQPATRAEVEEIRGVALGSGTLDVLIEAGWIRIRGRRKTPGRPVTYGTTEGFLDHFGLDSVDDLPGVEELAAAGLLTAAPLGGPPEEAPLDDQDEGADEAELDLALLRADGDDETA